MKYLTIKIKSQKKMNGRKQYGGSPTEAPEKCAPNRIAECKTPPRN
jgi:hypothetical protein